MYGWIRPQVALPVHGEALHLHEHARLARSLGVPHVVEAGDGDMIMFGPGRTGVVDQVHFGRVFKDGNLFVPPATRLSASAGACRSPCVVSIAVVLDGKGEIIGDPALRDFWASPAHAGRQALDDVIDDAVMNVLAGLSRQPPPRRGTGRERARPGRARRRERGLGQRSPHATSTCWWYRPAAGAAPARSGAATGQKNIFF